MAQASGPDWSAVTTVEQAEALVRSGELERMLLLPERFGGTVHPENVVYVPRGMSQAGDLVLAQAVQGLDGVAEYSATPVYEGSSVVPTLVRMTVVDQRGTRFQQNLRISG